MATAVEFFRINKNDTGCSIIGYTGTDSVVEIPAVIDGVVVTEIGSWAFQDCTRLTRVSIPVG